jgi:hypothetical protein
MEHEIFLFLNSPDAIRLHPGQANAEWQPSPEQPAIPLDNGPNRVAYVWGSPGDGEEPPSMHLDHIGDPVIQVFEGTLADVLWVPCSAVTLDFNPGVWLWICQPMSPKNPITEDWMLSISS